MTAKRQAIRLTVDFDDGSRETLEGEDTFWGQPRSAAQDAWADVEIDVDRGQGYCEEKRRPWRQVPAASPPAPTRSCPACGFATLGGHPDEDVRTCLHCGEKTRTGDEARGRG